MALIAWLCALLMGDIAGCAEKCHGDFSFGPRGQGTYKLVARPVRGRSHAGGGYTGQAERQQAEGAMVLICSHTHVYNCVRH